MNIKEAENNNTTNINTILVIDDDESYLDLIGLRLSDEPYKLITCSAAEKSMGILKKTTPDLIILDIIMPGIDGLSLLKKFRSIPRISHIPIILLSSLGGVRDIVTGLEIGANDYVTKPIDSSILKARVRAHLKTGNAFKNLENRNRVLTRIAALDELTGIYNRRSMFHFLKDEIDRSRRYRHFLSVLMIDVDHFKRINDAYGHAAGDGVLKEVVLTTKKMLRSNDRLCRYGGEEFLAILPETDKDNALRAAERIRSEIENRNFSVPYAAVRLTASLGVATTPPQTHISSDELIRVADDALYLSKMNGRNRVEYKELCL